MNVFKSLILFGFILSLFNCNEDSYDYWELNHFSFNENALKDGEEISLLYASRAPDYENKD